ncbi:hypothetical protein I6I42_00880 [Morganella morganii]|nr:hypothetical protein I6I42_00880 [Morganella morganii]
MTAEIAIYNKNCVALAADSAVTISSGSETGKQKIYNGAEKLFALSKHHPVGLMIFGSGSLSSSPWEIVIKAYRKYLGQSSFSKLEEYADDFFNFIETHDEIITQGMREESCFQFLSGSVFSGLLESFNSTKDGTYWSTFNFDNYIVELEEYCNSALSVLSEIDFLDGFTHDDIDVAREFCLKYTSTICHQGLEAEKLPDPFLNLLNEIFAIMLCKKSDIGNTSGLVLAGYGNDDYYPKVLSYDVSGIFKNKLRKSLNKQKCSDNGACGVTPFAQDDEVKSFMQGASPRVMDHLHDGYSNCFTQFVAQLDKILDSKVPDNLSIKDEIAQASQILFSDLNESVTNFLRENYINKVIDMVEFLPKQDIAYMAESLVNLTAFKRKISDDSETVGGPIDVAVISKFDGFIWVKRKHYFDKDLNYRFFSRP